MRFVAFTLSRFSRAERFVSSSRSADIYGIDKILQILNVLSMLPFVLDDLQCTLLSLTRRHAKHDVVNKQFPRIEKSIGTVFRPHS